MGCRKVRESNEILDKVAGGPGFEPGPSGPEPEVLPLNYPPVGKWAGEECRKPRGAPPTAPDS